MGKEGPCHHCGVTSTPLWRNGPLEKPILCNACGSRWRTKGTLANYTPLRARTEPDDFEDYRVSKVKGISFKSKETKMHKRKQTYNNEVIEEEAPFYDQNFHKNLDEETGNRSSSGSAVSYSDSCVQFGSTDANEFTGSSQPNMWDTLVPSRKRTCVSRTKPSSVEKLTQDLYSILHEQQSSFFSRSSEEDLLFESGNPMVSVEIGHGSVLMKPPNAVTREEESEASSLSVDIKPCPINEAYSGSASLPAQIDKKGLSFPSMSLEKVNKTMGHDGTQEEQTKRDKSHHETFQILQNHSSPLRSIDLKDAKHEQIRGGKRVSIESSVSNLYNSAPVKRHLDGQNQNIQELKEAMRSPRRVVPKANYDTKDLIDDDASCFSPRSLFASPPTGRSSLMPETFPFTDDNSDQDLLFDVPSNRSFPQAELLHPSSTSNAQQASK